MYILVLGNPLTGYKFAGPFNNEVEAMKYGEEVYAVTEWWIAPIELSALVTTNTNTNINTKNLYCSCGHLWSNHSQNVHRIWVCRECNCRGMNPPT